MGNACWQVKWTSATVSTSTRVCMLWIFSQSCSRALLAHTFDFIDSAARARTSSQHDGPCRISSGAWDNAAATESNVPACTGLCASLEADSTAWHVWAAELPSSLLQVPGTWETPLTPFQRLLVVKVMSSTPK